MRTPSFRVSKPKVENGLKTMPSRTARTSVPCASRMSMPAWKRSCPASPRASPNVPATSCGPSSGATGQSSGVRAKASASKAGARRGGGGVAKSMSPHGQDDSWRRRVRGTRPTLERRRDDANHRVAGVGDEEGGLQGDSRGPTEACVGRNAVGEAGRAAREQAGVPLCRKHHDLPALVGHVDVAARVHRHGHGSARVR